ncbi:MAG TPA: glutathione S-transferase family protein [Rhizomicrobium sp.]|nr:glutathione S-transferase family protein [Rhizomicrobium sp.]
MIKISAYKWVPPFVQGLVRDLRPRWALEELGLPYEVMLVALGPEQSDPDYRALQPFGQVPILEDGEIKLFESGAIVLHLASKSDVLLPRDTVERETAIAWIFAAINTMEVPITFGMRMTFANVTSGPLYDGNMEWIGRRLGELAAALGDNDYLVGNRFSAADLMMTTVLTQLRSTDLVAKHPTLVAYYARCTARPAYQKAMADQLAVFRANAPPA